MADFLNKQVEYFCRTCRMTRIMKVVSLESDFGIYWLKCPTCHESTMLKEIELENMEIIKLGRSPIKLVKKNSKDEKSEKYEPTGIYKVGQIIYHEAFEDKGMVVNRESGGDNLERITVHFENVGSKILVQGMTDLK